MVWDPTRSAYERSLFVRYGLLFQAWERYRDPPPLALQSFADGVVVSEPRTDSVESLRSEFGKRVSLSSIFD